MLKDISHYHIIDKIGTGGMGEVYVAKDVQLHRTVAIRLIPEQFRTPHARRRFMNEARAVASLDHPNIVSIYEIGEDEGRPFIVMPFVAGETLADKMGRGRLALPEVLDIAMQVAHALAAAHSHGVIHGGVNPRNILITPRGHVMLGDFGLATLTTLETERDLKSSTRAISAYMSPEQAREETLDARSDIFSFGVVFYEMVTGRPPFERESADGTLSAILTDEPAPLAKYSPHVSQKLQSIVSKALEKDKRERYQTMTELLSDLMLVGDMLVGETLLVEQPSAKLSVHLMANTQLPPLLSVIFSGLTFFGLLGAVYTGGTMVGEIRTTLSEQSKKLDELNRAVLDTKDGIGARTNRIEVKLDEIDKKISALPTQQRTAALPTGSTQSDEEITRLRATIASLQNQLNQLSAKSSQTEAELGRLREQSQRVGAVIDARLSVIDERLLQLRGYVSELGRRTPKDITEEMLRRIDSLSEELKGIRRQLKG